MTYPLEIFLIMSRTGPDPNIPPFQIYPDNFNEHAFQNIKHIKFEIAWDCEDLPALIDLFFNHSSIIEDDLNDKCDNLIHRMIVILEVLNQNKNLMKMLHSLWPAEGVDQAFIASIAQNDDSNNNKLELMTLPSPLLLLPRKDEKLKEDKQ
ncbi:hypothetical protein C2G38_2174648 [Gigaspora rosea]|uniref:Uncharacterized protein n=1 Tax=Gigaspora rosea TaxID=44941 RepID=A0A397VSU6_9GLOM|nr:hypothetical protein C2G38_2174648 [Gigaspora rosea]